MKATSKKILEKAAQQVSEPEKWGAPVNLLRERVPSPFDPQCVPAALRNYAELLAKEGGSDISIGLVSAVVCAAAAIADGAQLAISYNASWRQSARLWMVVVGPPGAAKTPIQKLMMAPLWVIHNRKVAAEQARWEKEWKPDSKEHKEPDRVRLVVSDATIEALGVVLKHSEDGILYFIEEASSLIGSLDRYHNTGRVNKDRGDWLALYDGGPRSIERVGRGTGLIPNWSASVLTATTPGTMEAITPHLNVDGFVQRFIIVWVRGIEERQEISQSELEAARKRYCDAINQMHKLASAGGSYWLSTEAKDAFDEWSKMNLADRKAHEATEPEFASHLSKLPNMALRLALVFHFAQMRRVVKPKVSAETMQDVIAFLESVAGHLTKLYLNAAASPTHALANDVARFILATLLKNGDGKPKKRISRQSIQWGVRHFKKADPRLQDSSMDVLCDASWLRPVLSTKNYKHPTQYEVNPLIAEMYAEQIATETEMRAARLKVLKRTLP